MDDRQPIIGESLKISQSHAKNESDKASKRHDKKTNEQNDHNGQMSGRRQVDIGAIV